MPREWHPAGRLEDDEHWGRGAYEGWYWLSNASKNTYAGLLFGLTLTAKLVEEESLARRARSLLVSLKARGWKVAKTFRRHGLRRARYRGLARVNLQCLFTALVVDIKRWFNLIRARAPALSPA